MTLFLFIPTLRFYLFSRLLKESIMTICIDPSLPTAKACASQKRQHKMRGFTLIELGVVLTIVAILALFAIPRVQGYLLSGRVQPTVAESVDAIGQLRALGAANGGAGQPYAGMTALNFATVLRDKAVALIPNVNGADSSVQHRLGAAGATVTFLADTITTAGDSIRLTFNSVNGAACVDLASALQAQARTVTITGSGAATTVKAAGANYFAQTAQTSCAAGDVNTLAFTFQ